MVVLNVVMITGGQVVAYGIGEQFADTFAEYTRLTLYRCCI